MVLKLSICGTVYVCVATQMKDICWKMHPDSWYLISHKLYTTLI